MTSNMHALPSSALIALGLDDKQRPRGAWFAQPTERLIAALTAMRCQVFSSIPKALEDLAVKLPEGRLLASGKVLLPGIRKELHQQLTAASVQENFKELTSTLNERLAPEGKAVGRSTPSSTPLRPWDDLRVGDVVLAPFGPDEGWWEATVVERENTIVTLKYRDAPKEPSFSRHISTLAQIHPDLL